MVCDAEWPLKSFFAETQGFVADARALRRVAEEAEGGLAGNFGDQRAEHFDAEVALIEEREGLIVAELKPAEFDLGSACCIP